MHKTWLKMTEGFLSINLYFDINLFPGHMLQKFHHCCLFLYKKPKLQNLTLPLNRSRSSEGHNVNKI